ncbi:gamma-glutamylcyclotransferase family protein [Oceaniglobus ichthyenteri]|uniref:gamma-glutamylcyclotransferase family protein n=1 Tax=Oceaniglobus ichthyenteri TaxID=2136177 RepID=UPI000D3B8CBF|nr:gamma-glutamylcyclotransferase family protein [Oceaniglobus ichthyenteri]
MRDPLFFGYGSLVNCATHTYPDLRPATLPGWRRVWRQTAVQDAAFLTAVPTEGGIIDGAIARVPNADWAALDAREMHYDRASAEIAGDSVAVYTIAQDKHPLPARTQPIYLSYLDVVVQGFARHFGPDGVARFFDTTDGWNAPILDDRAAPLYPRHQILSAQDRALVDRYLARVA